MKVFWKSINNWQRYRQKQSAIFFQPTLHMTKSKNKHKYQKHINLWYKFSVSDDVLPTWIFQKNSSHHPLINSGTDQLHVHKPTHWTGSIQSGRGDRCQINMALYKDKLQLVVFHLSKHSTQPSCTSDVTKRWSSFCHASPHEQPKTRTACYASSLP